MPITPAAASRMTDQELMQAMDHVTVSMTWLQSELQVNNAEICVRQSRDPRPILQQLKITDRAAWQRIWDDGRVAQCPVCHAERGPGVIWDGPMNGDVPTRCPHFLCTACWQNLYDRYQEGRTAEVRCPICRDDVNRWAERYGETEE